MRGGDDVACALPIGLHVRLGCREGIRVVAYSVVYAGVRLRGWEPGRLEGRYLRGEAAIRERKNGEGGVARRAANVRTSMYVNDIPVRSHVFVRPVQRDKIRWGPSACAKLGVTEI